MKKTGDFTGYSNSSVNRAIQDAMEKAGDHHARIEVVETRGSYIKGEKRHYQVTLATYDKAIS